MVVVDNASQDGTPENGWLAALRDPHIGRALGLLHAKPQQDWTLEELGRQVGMSRSRLHERFLELVGQPPIQYLTNWRMQRAASLLRDGNADEGASRPPLGSVIFHSPFLFLSLFLFAQRCPSRGWPRPTGARPAGD